MSPVRVLRRDRRADPGRSPAGLPGGQHRTGRSLLADRRVHPPQARPTAGARAWCDQLAALPRAARARPARLFAAEPVSHAAVLRGLPGRPETLTTGETNALDPQPDHPSQSKRPEEREFYLRMAVQERWGKRELERQIRLAAFERRCSNPPKLSPAVRQIHAPAASVFKDAYMVEFLDLPDGHTEADLHRGLLGSCGTFSSSWAATSASSARSTRCRWAAGTSRWTCCSSTAA